MMRLLAYRKIIENYTRDVRHLAGEYFLAGYSVPHIPYGLNQFLWKAFVYFITEIPNIHIDDVGECVMVISPYLLQNHGAAERAIGMGHEIFE